METIYTIPVNEAFEEADGCPFCRLREKLEQNEIDLILGASMMEPDVRVKTNKEGFCTDHYSKLFAAQKRLPLALMLESHLSELRDNIKMPKMTLKNKGEVIASKADEVNGSCYICERIDFHFGKMFETASILWENDKAFREKMKKEPYFCLKHYSRFLNTARASMKKKTYSDFTASIDEIESAYLEKLSGDVSWFVKKFDYNYKDEPWYDAKDAVERALKFFG